MFFECRKSLEIREPQISFSHHENFTKRFANNYVVQNHLFTQLIDHWRLTECGLLYFGTFSASCIPYPKAFQCPKSRIQYDFK